MGRKIIGVILLLLSGLSGLFFAGPVFMHGWNEGLARLDDLKAQQWLFALGAIFFFLVGLSAFFKKKT